MPRPFLPFLVLAALLHPTGQAATSTQSYSAGSVSGFINGIACADIVGWSGGDAVGDVVTAPTGKKHLGGVRYSPLVVEVAPPFSAPVLACINDLCTSSGTLRTLVVGRSAGQGSTSSTHMEAGNALISEVRVPRLAAASKEGFRITLVFQIESMRAAASAPAGTSPTTTRASAVPSSNFRLTVAGLDATRVSEIEVFTLKRAGTGSSVGEEHIVSTAPGIVVVPDLAVTLATNGSATWTTWRDDFLIQGNAGDEKEKDGAIDLLAPGLASVVFSIKLSHVGIRSLASLPDPEIGVPTSRVDLYCEAMSVAGAAPIPVAPATTQTSSPPAPAADPADSRAGSGAETPTPASTPSLVPTTVDRSNRPLNVESANLADVPPRLSAIAPATITPAAAPATASNPQDAGARDPAAFPRPPESIRMSYTTVRDKVAIQEQATYMVKTSSAAVMEFYEKSLTSEGWEEDARYENNYAADNAHQVISTWKKETRTVSITVVDVAPKETKIHISSDLRK